MTTATASGIQVDKTFRKVVVTLCNQPCCWPSAASSTSTLNRMVRSGWIATRG